MKLKDWLEERESRKEKRKSDNLHTAGFLVGAGMAIEAANEETEMSEIIACGLVGACGAWLFERVFPKSANMVKQVL